MNNPLAFFQRISLINKSETQLKNYLSFELAPIPLSIFDEDGMKKSDKSKLYPLFKPYDIPPSIVNYIYVIDGGFLLHKVVWKSKESFKNIMMKYVNFF